MKGELAINHYHVMNNSFDVSGWHQFARLKSQLERNFIEQEIYCS